ncbi:MAG: hypothetical protein O2854_01500 [Chloroflexi bacterium]|nr:hypothetical protein [Chloroflexota bacterium]
MTKKSQSKLQFAEMDRPRLPNPDRLSIKESSDFSGSTMLYDSCPRCVGTRYLDRDQFGWFLTCVACGSVSYPTVKDRPKRRKYDREVAGTAELPARSPRISFRSLRLV